MIGQGSLRSTIRSWGGLAMLMASGAAVLALAAAPAASETLIVANGRWSVDKTRCSEGDWGGTVRFEFRGYWHDDEGHRAMVTAHIAGRICDVDNGRPLTRKMELLFRGPQARSGLILSGPGFNGGVDYGVITGFIGVGGQLWPFRAVMDASPAANVEVTQQLHDAFSEEAQRRVKEGYFVKNDGWLRGLKHMIQDRTPFADKAKGGRCGDYGEWGMRWSKEFVEKIFGAGAVIDDIVMQERTSREGTGLADPQTWNPDKIYEANHRATRVILPDGRRYVLDYWEAVKSGKAELQTEGEWAKRWYTRISGWQPGDAVVNRSVDEEAIKNFVRTYGEEKGFELFRSQNNKQKKPLPPEQVETLFKSWQQENW